MQPLPIDPLLPDVVAALRAPGALVLEAPPGAGKTTRVPRALLDAGFLGDGEIVVLEPRRLAARLAARRVADELGERVGERVGYTVRFDDQSSRATRIRFVTEGVLTRRLVTSPRLPGVSAILLDEFHERHLQGDLALALLGRLMRSERPDLRVVVMSATLDGARVAAHLGCPVLRSEGKRFDVAIRHAERPDDRPLGSQVASAVRDLCAAGLDGHVLVFLPGAREIRAARAACERVAQDNGLSVVMLHGDLPPDEQDAALAPSQVRKVILSTNVAESSVTIDGIAAVIDGGLARHAKSSPWSGLPSLVTEKISRASAAQRAGRAGRTRAGTCIRLYTKGDHDARPEHDAPEIARADLADVVLELASQGLSPGDLPWLDAPPAPAVARASELLGRLGAVSAEGAITADGRALLGFPVHPRLARVVMEAARSGYPREGALLAALLSERDVRREDRTSFRDGPRGGSGVASDSDVLARLDDVARARRDRLDRGQQRSLGLDDGAVSSVLRAADRLARAVPRELADRARDDEETALSRALLVGFPDRVARRRRAGGRDLVLSGGGALVQAESSVVHDAPFVVVVSADGGDGRVPATARLVSAIDPAMLLDAFPERIHETREVTWVAASERVEVVERLLYDDLVLDETRKGASQARAASGDDVAAALASAALARGLSAFVDPPDALEAWLARARFVASVDPTFPAFDDEGLRVAMRALCEGRSSFAELRRASLLDELAGRLTPTEAQRLREWAPERIALPSGRKASVAYEPGKPPYVASRMADFFGLSRTPTVAGGRVPLVVHLLAPNQRPVQITQDVEGFWKRHYPSIRKELCRKYPRHPWPEDPTVAIPAPPPRGGPRG